MGESKGECDESEIKGKEGVIKLMKN